MSLYRLSGILLICMLLTACGNGDAQQKKEEKEDTLPTVIPATTIPPTPTVEVVAVIDSAVITRPVFDREVEALLENSSSQPADLATFEAQVLEGMIDFVIIQQYAVTHGIQISQEAIDAEIASLQSFADQNQTNLAQLIGYPEDMIQAKVYEILLIQAVSQHVVDNMPTTATQVRARHILVKDEALARTIITQLDNGVSFGELAQQYSQDPTSAPLGGDLGWIVQGDLLQAEVEEILFQMPVNSRWPDPIATEFGFHIVECLERVDNQPLDEVRLNQRRQTYFMGWLADQRTNLMIERYLTTSPNQ